jgi:Holliday junction resolvase RusA-like endonuclease
MQVLEPGQVVTVRIPGRPGAKARSRTSFFNRKGERLDKPRTYNPESGVRWQTHVMDCVQAELFKAGWPKRLEMPIEVSWIAVFPRPKTKPDHIPKGEWKRGIRCYRTSRPDRDNIDKAVLDGCTRAELWQDDKWAVDGRLSMVYASESESPALHLRLTTLPYAFRYIQV